MTRPLYIEAGGLVSAADALLPSASGRDHTIRDRIVRLIAGPDMTTVSEIGLLEVHSNICDHLRDTGRPDHNDLWADQAIHELRKWVAMGDLLVLPTPAKLADKAMTQVEIATRQMGGRLRGWDAAHVVMATEWARELGIKVTIVTSDADFADLLSGAPEFADHIDLLDPST